MSKTKNKYSVSKATKGNKTIYLSTKDEENGIDIQLDLLGYKIVAL